MQNTNMKLISNRVRVMQGRACTHDPQVGAKNIGIEKMFKIKYPF